ncbi:MULTISPECIES: hypothetical protein [unclassified Actinobaculum]|uniref:hypothetical protein n=1 Tax=unclassified Actinobaculum TaxID=2609299 RepID=UPI000D52655F|nr:MULTISPECIES: hypothetical protein [unclassified Actinobaculum]AWE41578.1 hypothetical protein DDD63_00990 [Actinobaculum sp. 313]RTE49197.1 hypothetical protein EKN07_06365 [Actinobaculum sp. 352]
MKDLDRPTLHRAVTVTCALIAIALAFAARQENLVGPSVVAMRHGPMSWIVLLVILWFPIAWFCIISDFPRVGIVAVPGLGVATFACGWLWTATLIRETIGPKAILWTTVALLALTVATAAALTAPAPTKDNGKRRLSAVVGVAVSVVVTAALLTLPPTYLPGKLTTSGVTAGNPPAPKELSENTEAIWVHEIPEPYVTVLATHAGPVVVTAQTAQLLDPTSGEAVWTYTRGLSIQVAATVTTSKAAEQNSAVALRFEVSPSSDRYPSYYQTVLLDAATGETLEWQDEFPAPSPLYGRYVVETTTQQMPYSSAIEVRFDSDGDGYARSDGDDNSFIVPLEETYLSGDPMISGTVYDVEGMHLLLVKLEGGASQFAAPSNEHTLIFGLH